MAGKKILVADDSLTIQKVIRLALSGDGYEIQTVSDGKEATEQASLFRPDICIIDVSLPHYDAYQIRENFIMKPDLKNIPVILMSSAFEKVDEARAEKLGFAGHLVKPFDPSHLRSILLAVANQTPANDPVTAMINDTYAPERMSFTPPRAMPSAFQENTPQATSSFQDIAYTGLDDIQQLARNTLEMSGLNQQDWGMIEPGKMEHPFQDQQEEVASFDMSEIPQAMGYSGDTHGKISVTAEELEVMVKTEVAKLLELMNGQVHERVENDLKQYAQELMPSLAERILKEEIHKLLANPPH